MSNKQSKPVLSTRVDPQLITNLDDLCKATDRERSYHVERAIRDYLQAQMWQVEAVVKGIEAADAGKLKPLEAVKKTWQERSGSNAE